MSENSVILLSLLPEGHQAKPSHALRQFPDKWDVSWYGVDFIAGIRHGFVTLRVWSPFGHSRPKVFNVADPKCKELIGECLSSISGNMI